MQNFHNDRIAVMISLLLLQISLLFSNQYIFAMSSSGLQLLIPPPLILRTQTKPTQTRPDPTRASHTNREPIKSPTYPNSTHYPYPVLPFPALALVPWPASCCCCCCCPLLLACCSLFTLSQSNQSLLSNHIHSAASTVIVNQH